MGTLYDEYGNEVGYINDGNGGEPSRAFLAIVFFLIAVVIPIFHWILAIGMIFDGNTPIAHRRTFIFAIVAIIATMVIHGKKISKRSPESLSRSLFGTVIELTVSATILSGVIMCLFAISDWELTLFAAIRMAFFLSVLPAFVTDCIINRERNKKKIKQAIANRIYMIKNLISIWTE